jgi:hypothetical protein
MELFRFGALGPDGLVDRPQAHHLAAHAAHLSADRIGPWAPATK